MKKRIQFPLILIIGLLLSISSAITAQQTLELELFAEELGDITNMKQLPNGNFLVIQKKGNLVYLDSDGIVLSASALDLRAHVGNAGGEKGLLGIAIDPDFTTTGRIYLNHTDVNGDTKIVRYTAGLGTVEFDPNSREELITIEQPFSNHNGGDLNFGPDGYLYIATGDGGAGGDPENNGQDLNTLLGKILRIDVSGATSYQVPADNPFVNNPNALDEIWTYGWRNPWRFSFDSETGDMWIADVGQNKFEEINIEPASSTGGLNYGWRCYEGNQEFNMSPPCNGPVEFPYYVYGRDHGCSITGGINYRGDEDFRGYIYGDFCNGNTYALIPHPVDETKPLKEYEFFTGSAASYMEDDEGDIYLVLLDAAVLEMDIDCGQNVKPTIEADKTVLCGDSIRITVSVPDGFHAVLIIDGKAIDVNTSGSFVVSEPGAYQVYLQGLCFSPMSDVIEITENTVTVDLEYEKPFISATDGFSNYKWYDADGNLLQDSDENELEVSESGVYTVVITDENGCTAQATIDVTVTSIEETHFINSIFPNPASSVLNVEMDSPTSSNALVSIYNIDGKLVKSFNTKIENGFNNIEINLESFTSGNYSFTITALNNEVKTGGKFMVQK